MPILIAKKSNCPFTPEQQAVMQAMFERGESLRRICDHMEKEHDVFLQHSTVRYWAAQGGWDPSNRQLATRFRHPAPPKPSQPLVTMCQTCGGRVQPGRPHQHPKWVDRSLLW